MPELLQYFIKLSVCIAAVFVFYQFVLRRLTFYNWNRWFLLLYSVIAFIIPLINAGWLLQQNTIPSGVVHFIPAVEAYAPAVGGPAQTTAAFSFSFWDVVTVVMASGCFVLSCRLVILYISYLRIVKKAQLVSDEGAKVYQVDAAIIPFSFGRSIFINQQLHTEAELTEIIRHEWVHVKQKHTIDVIWSEVFCLLNWYNPLAWLLRRAIRQNLEFIADNKVLESGTNKKEYQYLLLKVMGAPGFRMASQFNFTSLKKRIIMMNKLKSSSMHLVKFLFVLPLAVVLLLAFRNVAVNSTSGQKEPVTLTGLVVQAGTYQPLKGVRVVETNSGSESFTNENGFYTITLSKVAFPLRTEVNFEKEGFSHVNSSATIKSNTETPVALIDIVNLEPVAKKEEMKGYSTQSVIINKAAGINTPPTYQDLLQQLENRKKDWIAQAKLQQLSQNTSKPYWVIDGKTFVMTRGGGFASVDEVTDIVYVDGRRLTGEKVNQIINRNNINGVGAMEKSEAYKKYGVDKAVLEIYLTTPPSH